ncbi:TonB-dependent receptor domain-containing protein [Brevundimonas staleyi]|uniref:TonB-dependent receptor domain-containing protein n=1 Tax=Brevundimonas staleyi TaxID=74326 RepID=A0ABW0FQ96_9CAUL
MTRMTLRSRALCAASALAVATLMTAGSASAQATNATVRGTLYDGAAVETGGAVVATEISTGFTYRGRVGADGGYVIVGLRPGTYRIAATSADGQTVEDTVTLSTGQIGTLDLDVAGSQTAAADTSEATDVGDIVVTGRRIFEVRTSEVATGVTQQQINNLPQINRNFLNFAALAPGVRVTEGESERTISAGGQPAQAINVFIDGQNQKSTIIDGGVAGQDDSRGNPFPQAGVQEFRVITQNFKAEYEQAGSAIITAVTRSGTNEFHGEVFATYQDPSWVDQNVVDRRANRDQPDVEREQYGFALGGPIIQDRLHFFVTYERKDEGRAAGVVVNNSTYAGRFANEIGNYASPFEQDLAFGKLSWQIDDRQRLEVTGTYRSESEIRGFGAGSAFSRAEEANSDIRSANVRHSFQGDNFLNELTYDYFSYTYNPTALNFGDYGRTYAIFRDANTNVPGFQFDVNNRVETVFQAGGRADSQYIEQESHTLRNDLTIPDLQWMGTHTVKMGVKYSMQNYFLNKQFGRNPQFVYDLTGITGLGGANIPVSVQLGTFSPPTSADNNVLGLYIQDDWQITDKLEFNLGLRWDYEDNAVNNDYVTPAGIRDMLTKIQALPNYDFPSYFNPSDYISDGNRDAFTGAFQPRFGFSYDVFADEQTVIFGGAGRYYDRIGFNFAFDERFKPTQFIREVFFSQNGGPVSGVNTVAWNPSYLTAAGLDPLLASTPGAGEVFLVANDAEPPRTDQFNFGVRQKFGIFQTALTLAYSKTANISSWAIANAGSATGDRFSGPTPTSVGHPEFRNLVFFQNQDKEAEFRAMYLTIDKPFDAQSNWGFNLAYTLSKATQNGSRDNGFAAFDFDYNVPGLSPEYPSNTDERHRIVASGTVGLPAEFLLSGIVTLGSGLPFNVFDCPGATNPNICWNGGRPERRAFLPGLNFAFRQVDLRLTKTFPTWTGHEVQFIADAINIFGFDNYTAFEGGYNNPRFGQGNGVLLPTRSFQVGLRYVF